MNSTNIEMPPDSFRAVLDQLWSPVYTAQAVRDEATGQITDFRFTFVNAAFGEWVNHSLEDLLGASMRALFPHFAQMSLFTQFEQVVETQDPYRGEAFFPNAEGRNWLDVSVKRLEDGIVVNFIDISHRKQTELDLQQANDLLATIINASINGMFALRAVRQSDGKAGSENTVDFDVLQANPVAADLLNLPAQQLQGRRITDLFPGLKASGLLDELAHVADAGVPFRSEQYYPYDGINQWFTILAEPFNQGVILTFLDITERRLAEDQLQQANNALQATLDASISSILAMTAIRNEQGQVVDFWMDKANRAVERSLGKTPAELEGRTLLSVYPGNVESGFFARYAKAADTGELQQTTLHYTDVNGYQGWFEASAVRHAPDKIVLTFMNVTEYKQTEVLVRQQAELVQSVLNATMNTVTTYEAIRSQSGQIVDFRFTLANQAALAVVGMTADELYTKTLLEVSPDLHHSEGFDQYVNVVQTGQPMTFERNRQGRWFLANAVPFGKDGLLTSSIDITSLKQAQLQIERLNEQLQRSNASLDQFAAVASHDLQEPLRKIKSFGDILQDQYAPNLGDGVGLLRRMQSAADRMQTLIRDLLAYSRLSQEQATSYQAIDMNRLIKEVVTDLEVAIEEKGAILEIEPLPTLTGDPLQLRQVFQNLLSNALKFTKPGRIPTVVLKAQRVTNESVPSGFKLIIGPYWQITVADNGIGFGEKYREQIFGAFERLHSKTSVYGGTGIGLAIVRKVMDNHRGAVTAHSIEDQGATFTLFFPVDQLPVAYV